MVRLFCGPIMVKNSEGNMQLIPSGTFVVARRNWPKEPLRAIGLYPIKSEFIAQEMLSIYSRWEKIKK